MADMRPLFYSFPGTWLVVDDQERFLTAMEMVIPSDQPYILSDNPREALTYISHQSDSFLGRTMLGRGEEDSDDYLLRFDLDLIVAQVTNRSRFAGISVVISDFAMPGMDGIQFLSSITSESIKKVLLTGVADEKLAVRAFNAGIIDRFILKSDPNAMQQVVDYSLELQMHWLMESQTLLRGVLPGIYSQVFESKRVRDFILDQMKCFSIVEYYFSSSPFGFYCLDIQGKAIFFALVNSEMLEEKITRLVRALAPGSILDGLRQQSIFVELFEVFQLNNGENYDWEYNSVDIQEVSGEDGLFWGVHDEPPMDIDFDPATHSLKSYLLGR